MAHKLARLVYRLLKFGQQYVDKGMEHYETRFRQHRLAVASVFDSPQPAIFLMYLVPSLELRQQAAEQLGGHQPPAVRVQVGEEAAQR